MKKYKIQKGKIKTLLLILLLLSGCIERPSKKVLDYWHTLYFNSSVDTVQVKSLGFQETFKCSYYTRYELSSKDYHIKIELDKSNKAVYFYYSQVVNRRKNQ